jgi:hypothetical protein
MKKNLHFLAILAALWLAGCNSHGPSDYRVEVRNNTETLFIIYTIADTGVMPVPGSLSHAAGEAFAGFSRHAAVEMVRGIIREKGVSAPVWLVHQFSDLPAMRLQQELQNADLIFNDTDDPETLAQWLDAFRKAFTDFYHEAGVEAFLEKHRNVYEKALKDVHRHLPAGELTRVMEDFYGQQHAGYVMNLSPVLYPTWGFGTSIKTEEGLLVFNTFGPLRRLSRPRHNLRWDFNNKEAVRNLSVHEFGHSFVNPLTELPEHRELIAASEHLFEPIAGSMAAQGYPNWWISLTEHLVRLGEIRIAEAMGDRRGAQRLRKYHTEQKQFIYLPLLEEKILEYEAQRDRYPGFGDFLPELLGVLVFVDR